MEDDIINFFESELGIVLYEENNLKNQKKLYGDH